MNKIVRSLGVFACALVLSSCLPEHAVAPGGTVESVDDRSTDAGRLKTAKDDHIRALGLFRTAPLTADMSSSKRIGPEGGSIAIPGAGVAVTVPAGALVDAIDITVTARKGRLIAYDFQPHGTVFAKPIILTQQLLGTNVSPGNIASLKLGYYESPQLLTTDGGTISEERDGVVSPLGQVFTSTIAHFSGYIVSCGQRPTLDED